jgi:hypothetical protein
VTGRQHAERADCFFTIVRAKSIVREGYRCQDQVESKEGDAQVHQNEKKRASGAA